MIVAPMRLQPLVADRAPERPHEHIDIALATVRHDLVKRRERTG
jgi:hypothetical protein